MGENASRAKGKEEEERGPPLFIALQEGRAIKRRATILFLFAGKKTLCLGFCGGVLVYVSGERRRKS